MLLYIIPFLVFVISAAIMYFVSKDSEKNKPETILIRNALPGLVIGTMVFVILKFKDTHLFSTEPVMQGNYFD
jgi:RsiW-degrading membrane proteinase PrsW (M82 family)